MSRSIDRAEPATSTPVETPTTEPTPARTPILGQTDTSAETTPPAEEIGERQARTDQEYPLEAPAQAAHAEQYDPSYHSVREVKEHLAQVHDPEERDRIKQAEEAGRGRKGILKA